MTDRQRKRGPIAAELAVLIAAGDNRAAAARARRVLSGGDPADAQDAARAVLARVKPERAAALMAAVCLVLLILAAVLGLRT